MLSVIWQDSDTAEVLFLIAAIVFFVQLVAVLFFGRPVRGVDDRTVNRVGYAWVGDVFLAIGLTLAALGLLAL